MDEDFFFIERSEVADLEKKLLDAGVPRLTQRFGQRDLVHVIRTIDMAKASLPRIREHVEQEEVVFESVPGGEIWRCPVRALDGIDGTTLLSVDALHGHLAAAVEVAGGAVVDKASLYERLEKTAFAGADAIDDGAWERAAEVLHRASRIGDELLRRELGDEARRWLEQAVEAIKRGVAETQRVAEDATGYVPENNLTALSNEIRDATRDALEAQ